MDQVLAALDATWRILLIGILLGAGLPALFAIGVRALVAGTPEPVAGEKVKLQPTLAGRLIAGVMFTIVIAAVALGIGYIVAHGLGMTITFNGLLPVFTPKH